MDKLTSPAKLTKSRKVDSLEEKRDHILMHVINKLSLLSVFTKSRWDDSMVVC